jgi:endonuclease/exonuclease/phosphatase family metal-dependent hydrolase
VDALTIYTLNCQGAYWPDALSQTFHDLYTPDAAATLGGMPDVMLLQEYHPRAETLHLQALAAGGHLHDTHILNSGMPGGTVAIATNKAVLALSTDQDAVHYHHFKTTEQSQHGVLFARYRILSPVLQEALQNDKIEVWNAHLDAWFNPRLRGNQMMVLRSILDERTRAFGRDLPVIGGGDMNSLLLGENRRNDSILKHLANITASIVQSFNGKHIEPTSRIRRLYRGLADYLPVRLRPDNIYVSDCFRAIVKAVAHDGSDHFLIGAILEPAYVTVSPPFEAR